jgi:MFS family permease
MTRVAYGYLTAALIDVVAAAAILSFPYMAKYLGLGNFGTIANTLLTFAYIVVCLLVSRFRVFRDRRVYLVLGCLLIAAGSLLVVLVKTKATLLISAGLFGTGIASFYPTLQAWFTEGMDNRRIIRVMGGYAIAWVTGYLCGPFLAGLALAPAGDSVAALERPLNLIFGVSAAVAALSAVFFIPDIFRRDRPSTGKRAAVKEPPHRVDVPQERIRLFVYLMWINNFAAFFLTGLIRFVFTEMGKAEHLSPLVVGSVTTVLYLSIIPVTMLLRVWHPWIFSFRWLVGFQLLSIPAVVFLAFTTSVPLYFVSAVLFGIISAFAFFASASYSLMLTGKKDTFININEAIIGAGGFLSAFAGWLLAEFVSVKSSVLPGLVMIVLSLAIQAAVHKTITGKTGRAAARGA